MFENKKILITGGTGSLGRALTKRLLKEDVETIRILSRNENKQVMMASEFSDDDRLRFLIGDVRDKPRLLRAVEGVDIVFHAAALKHIDIVEYNPFEAVKTNVLGSQNIIDVCHELNIETAIAIGTDKAVSPLNVYGATKLLMEKLFVTASSYVDKEKHRTKFLAIRYGNVLGSSGSVIPRFVEQILSKKKLTITDPIMTRFTITMDEALDFILNSVAESKGSDTFVPKLKAYNIMDLKDALFSLLGDTGFEITKIRPGEKITEVLINSYEMRRTVEGDKNYVIIHDEKSDDEISELYPNHKRCTTFKEYSAMNAERLSKNELQEMIKPLIPYHNKN